MKKKARLIMGSSSGSADIFYASGFSAPDPFVYFSSGSEKMIVVSTLEYNRALSEAKKGVRVLNRREFADKGDKKEPSTLQVLTNLARRSGAATLEVPYDFPAGLAKRLEESGVEVVCAEGMFFPGRLVKSARETALILRSLRLAEQSIEKAVEMLADSRVDSRGRLVWEGEILTSETMRAEMESLILRGGGRGDDTIVSCGIACSEPHNRGSGPILAGKTIIMDVFPRDCSSGYFGDITRTFVKGRPESPVIKKAFEAVREARDKSMEKIRDGAKASDVHAVSARILEKRGFRTGKKNGRDFGYIHSLGHGVGLEIHEPPRLSPANSAPLRKGNVVTVEPGVYYPEWGGVRLEDMVVVGRTSCERLTSLDDFLQID